MSDSSQILVDVDVPPEAAGAVGGELRAWLIAEGIIDAEQLGDERAHAPGHQRHAAILGDPPSSAWRVSPNTVALRVGRQVFDAGGNGVELRCAACGQTYEPGDDWIDAVGAWADGDDKVTYTCERCGASAPLTAWRGPWQWGFGSLGVEFWNWPPLSELFIQRLAHRLGHTLVLVQRRL